MTISDQPAGFWSYVHADNDAENGRVLRLCERIEAEYSLITGNEIHMFVDRDDISWGGRWRETIDDALAATTFFIPIVTARYLKRPECRRELIQFAQHTERRGVKELLLPILYTVVSSLKEDSDDEVNAIIASTQYEDWTALRLEDEQGPLYRAAVNKLALRLAEIADTISERPEVLTAIAKDATLTEEVSDDAPGILDDMAEVEVLFPTWTKTIETLSSEITEIGDLFTDYAPKLGTAGRSTGAAAKLAVARRLASELDPMADRILDTATEYADQALRMDSAISGILLNIADDFSNVRDDGEFEKFAEGIRGLRDGGEKAVQGLDGMNDSAQRAGSMSRDLRKPLSKISRALQRFMDGQGLFDEWVRRIDDIEAARG
ncbi:MULTISPECIES: toll/interleukin-1 receptor domain-containing protein [unclassified Rhodococcus (in: high G+C Gram-positive bacteria)]|jgi:hypothetical protein|uniref:toll/interleukin-1 receptor domain-containing protein n=1 Tax=unclassified Rhodococcus (in: high G+C Gram-positive bacteria) TaxID=192944 RepID=UPI00036A0BD1|nr:toll/interleukin-1 receptor domain-containing protein [Rhodococcus sp. DK17]